MKKILIVAITTLVLVVGMVGTTVSTAEAKRPHGVKVRAVASDALIMQGEYVYIDGEVKRGGGDSKVLLQRRMGHHGHWKKVDLSRTHNGGRFSVQDDSKKAKKTRWYRVVRPASGHGPRAVSKKMKVKVVPWDGRVDVTLTWDGPADIDLAMSDANGAFISADDPTPSGTDGVFESAHPRGCGRAAGGSERIYWPADNAPFGNYQVRLLPRKMCGDSNPKWHVEARVAGELIADFHGDGEYLQLDWRLIFGDTSSWDWEVVG